LEANKLIKDFKDFKRTNDAMVIVGMAPNSRVKTPWNNSSMDLFGINETRR